MRVIKKPDQKQEARDNKENIRQLRIAKREFSELFKTMSKVKELLC